MDAKILDLLSDGHWHDLSSDTALDALGAVTGFFVAIRVGVLVEKGLIEYDAGNDGLWCRKP